MARTQGPTYQPNKEKRKKVHGFRNTSASVLNNRRAKGRKKLSA